MTNPIEIADGIESGFLSDYDGWLNIYFNGELYTDCEVYIDENVIVMPMQAHILSEWLRGISDDPFWTVRWVNK